MHCGFRDVLHFPFKVVFYKYNPIDQIHSSGA